MADRHFVTGQVYVADGTTTTDKNATRIADAGDTVITVDGGPGDFTITMANGTSGTVTSGTAVVTGSPVTLVPGANVITVDGNGTVTLNLILGTGAGWNDVNSWSAASGGACGASVPGSSDNAYFDANSFTAAGQTVTLSGTSACKALDWTGATNSPTLALVTYALIIYGDITLIAAITVTSTTGVLFPQANVAQSITTNGLVIGANIYKEGAGVLTLADDLNIGTKIFRMYGSVDLNGNDLTCGTLLDGGVAGAKTITLGAGTINCTTFSFTSDSTMTLNLDSAVINCTSWTLTGADITVPANTATINCSGNFAGGGKVYHNVNLTAAVPVISGSNTFSTLTVDRSAKAKTLRLTEGTTQTVADLPDVGHNGLNIDCTGAGGATLTKSGGGEVFLDRVSLKNVEGTPADTWYYGPFHKLGVGVSGWQYKAAKYTPNAGMRGMNRLVPV